MVIPLLLALPIMTGLAGLFGGAMLDDKVEATRPPAGGANQSQMPWYVTAALVVGGMILAIIVIKGLLQKSKII